MQTVYDLGLAEEWSCQFHVETPVWHPRQVDSKVISVVYGESAENAAKTYENENCFFHCRILKKSSAKVQ
jgi:hypothetical protein